MYFDRLPKIEKGKRGIGRYGFVAEWNKSLEEWTKSEDRNLEKTVGGYDIDDNRELEEANGRRTI